MRTQTRKHTRYADRPVTPLTPRSAAGSAHARARIARPNRDRPGDVVGPVAVDAAAHPSLPLSAMDEAMLRYHRGHPGRSMGVGYLLHVDGPPPALASLRAYIADRVRLSPILASRLESGTGQRGHRGRHRWVVDARFDPAGHVFEHRLPAGADQADIGAAVDRLSTLEIPLTAPPWQVWLIHGHRPDRFAVLYRGSHIQVDGASSNMVLLRLFGPAATAPASRAWPIQPDRRPGARSAARAALGALGWLTRTHTVGPLAGTPTGQPRHHWEHVEVARLRAIARAHGSTVNDVFLAALAGALRAWSPAGPDGTGQPRGPVHASIPVSTRREAESGRLGNYVAGVRVALPCDLDTAARRIEAVRRQTARLKRDGNLGAVERLFFEAVPAGLRPLALSAGFTSRGVALAMSNSTCLPGPLAVVGRPVTGGGPIAALLGRQRLVVLLGGVDQTATISFIVDETVRDRSRLPALVLGELDALERSGDLVLRGAKRHDRTPFGPSAAGGLHRPPGDAQVVCDRMP